MQKPQINQPKMQAASAKHRALMSTSVKESVGLVFEKLGGVNGYAKWAAKNPDKFYDHYMKILPVELKAEVNVTTDFTHILDAARNRAAETVIEEVALSIIEHVSITEPDKTPST